jgi:TRAP-type mannitol/chloroaromatic compound transport system, small permease component
VSRLINGGLLLVAKLCLVTVVLTVGYTVVMRFVFNNSPNWTFDLSTLMMLPLTYLAAGAIAADKGHVTVDVVVEMVGPRVGRLLEAIGEAIAAVFVVYIAYHVSSEFIDIFGSGQVTGSARLPYWPAALCVPIGLVALAVEFAREATVSVRTAFKKEEAAS